MTAVTDRSAVNAPIAGSDQLNPTVFSANVADAFRSPYIRCFPPGVPSKTVKVAL